MFSIFDRLIAQVQKTEKRTNSANLVFDQFWYNPGKK